MFRVSFQIEWATFVLFSFFDCSGMVAPLSAGNQPFQEEYHVNKITVPLPIRTTQPSLHVAQQRPVR
jgi:hypothetical protein